MMAVLCSHFASFYFEAKRMAVFRFRFASFRFEAKMMAVFRFSPPPLKKLSSPSEKTEET
jgi:hypothetical protein